MAQYAVDRENAMATANLASACRDFETAYQLYLKVLDAYPNDARALDISARAAILAGHDDAAIALYKRSIQPGDRYSLGTRSALMAIYIRLGRWDDLEAERLETRKVSLAGHDRTLSADKGYPIDSPKVGIEYAQVLEFPTLHGEDNTRNEFLLYNEKDPCTGFTAHIDLESPGAGEIPPDGSPAATRTFSLIAFPTPGTEWLLKTYPAGEPAYQTVRSDVQSALSKPLTQLFDPRATCPATSSAVPSTGQHPN